MTGFSKKPVNPGCSYDDDAGKVGHLFVKTWSTDGNPETTVENTTRFSAGMIVDGKTRSPDRFSDLLFGFSDLLARKCALVFSKSQSFLPGAILQIAKVNHNFVFAGCRNQAAKK
jgi:hypothetical protein